MAARQSGTVGNAAVWMFVLSILLFWLPVIGPFIAGFVGGRKVPGVGDAILAALLPGLILGALFFFFGSILTGLPFVAFIAGLGAVGLAFVHIGPLLLGAIIGALV